MSMTTKKPLNTLKAAEAEKPAELKKARKLAVWPRISRWWQNKGERIMLTIIRIVYRFFGRMLSWWQSRGRIIVHYIIWTINGVLRTIGRILRMWLFIGLLSLIVLHFYPELGNKYPIFFQISEGVISAFEFIFRSIFSLLSSIFSSQELRIETLEKFFEEFSFLLQEFWKWIQSIHF